uniref:PCZ2.4 n=1 Tax=Planococcus sp. ZOYM TaxID=378212 RepID=Q1PHH3_9BACL|nr:hypothetical protein [Planococcus sp. ZOYM]ABE02510.1 PCZ2.4 [Planococcus sp. ZOYM]
MVKLKSIKVLPLALAFMLLPLTAFANEGTAVKNLATSKEIPGHVDALDIQEEEQELKSLGLNPNDILLKDGDNIELNFDDGSKIEYELEVAPTPVKRTEISNERNAVNALAATALYKTYKVSKTYYYGTASAKVTLGTDVKHVGREAWVRNTFAGFSGSLSKNDGQTTRTIDGYALSPDLLTTELSGQFTNGTGYTGDYFSRTYLIRADIDTAGFARLRVID